MSDPYEIKEHTKARIAKHARPFVDNFDDVINRILDVFEQVIRTQPSAAASQEDVEVKIFNSASPPNLTHTKVLSIALSGTKFAPELTTWNALLFEAIRIARKKIKSDLELREVIAVNFVFGRKENDGYRYLEDADLSVQGQDSNGAWKGTFQIARRLELTFDVLFMWREKEGSANPRIRGRFLRTKFHTL